MFGENILPSPSSKFPITAGLSMCQDQCAVSHFTEQTVFLSAMAEQPQLDRFLPDTSGMLLASGLVTEDLCLSGVLVPPALKG
jgi:hypothetical protein